MTHSHRLSSGSVSCRLEWRPSRWVVAALLLLGVFAAFSVLVSAMPRPMAWPLAVSALACGLWRARLEWFLPGHELFFPGNELPVMLDGSPIDNVRLLWRGPLAFLRWQDRQGRTMRLSWWPDSLSAERRRELRLAAGPQDASRHRPAMAP
jgi:toxin CptA